MITLIILRLISLFIVLAVMKLTAWNFLVAILTNVFISQHKREIYYGNIKYVLDRELIFIRESHCRYVVNLGVNHRAQKVDRERGYSLKRVVFSLSFSTPVNHKTPSLTYVAITHVRACGACSDARVHPLKSRALYTGLPFVVYKQSKNY